MSEKYTSFGVAIFLIIILSMYIFMELKKDEMKLTIKKYQLDSMALEMKIIEANYILDSLKRDSLCPGPTIIFRRSDKWPGHID